MDSPIAPIEPLILTIQQRQAIMEVSEVVRAHFRRVFCLTRARRVRYGPFAGLSFQPLADTLPTPMMLGVYERELWPVMERLIAAAPSRVVNVGCGVGYYAVGLAMRLPGAGVFAFDTDPACQAGCGRLSVANGCAERVRTAGELTAEGLAALAGPGTVILCDCEGGEDMLLDPVRVPALADCAIVVETHDFLLPGSRQRLIDRFTPTHAVEVVGMDVNLPDSCEEIRNYDMICRGMILGEYRQRGQDWLVLTPKAASA